MTEAMNIAVANAIDQNNAGAKQLHNSNHHDAITSFVEALGKIRCGLRQLEQQHKYNDCTNNLGVNLVVETDRLSCFRQHSSESSSLEYVHGYATTITYIKRKPYNHDDDGVDTCYQSCINVCNAVSGIIVWNLALAHHLVYLTSSQDQQQDQGGGKRPNDMVVSYLRKAKRFYECAYQIHVNGTKRHHDRSNLLDWTKGIAILNNLAIVNENIGEEESTTIQYWQTLISMISHYQTHNFDANSTAHYCVTREDICNIFGNITIFFFQCPVIAASAA